LYDLTRNQLSCGGGKSATVTVSAANCAIAWGLLRVKKIKKMKGSRIRWILWACLSFLPWLR
jgi:hypothetical protein